MNRGCYDVRLRESQGWRVEIIRSDGEVLCVRACRDGAEARIYASTVRQHISWLSPEAFLSYYSVGR